MIMLITHILRLKKSTTSRLDLSVVTHLVRFVMVLLKQIAWFVLIPHSSFSWASAIPNAHLLLRKRIHTKLFITTLKWSRLFALQYAHSVNIQSKAPTHAFNATRIAKLATVRSSPLAWLVILSSTFTMECAWRIAHVLITRTTSPTICVTLRVNQNSCKSKSSAWALLIVYQKIKRCI